MTKISNFLISESFAADVGSLANATPQGSLMSFLPLLLIFLVFYFLLVRPQQKKIKEHQNVLNSLKKGDKIYTNSGIFGVLRNIDDKEQIVELEIADNVVIKVLKQSISDVVGKKSNDKSKK